MFGSCFILYHKCNIPHWCVTKISICLRHCLVQKWRKTLFFINPLHFFSSLSCYEIVLLRLEWTFNFVELHMRSAGVTPQNITLLRSKRLGSFSRLLDQLTLWTSFVTFKAWSKNEELVASRSEVAFKVSSLQQSSEVWNAGEPNGSNSKLHIFKALWKLKCAMHQRTKLAPVCQ